MYTPVVYLRRDLLKMLGLAPLVACTTKSMTSTTPDAPSGSTCSTIPSETGGPFPGDGTNGPNALTTSGVVRSDIRASFDTATGVATGTVLTVTLTVVDVANGCTPLAGHAVYIWHADATGNYSMYSQATVKENYLRGVQVTDENGQVTFTTVFPGCYPGRWPHIHVEVYASLAAATSGANAVKTTQIALPEAASSAVYAQSAYGTSATSFANESIADDSVFSDGATLETPTISGDVSTGFAIALVLGT